MKTIFTQLLFVMASLNFVSCSIDNQIPEIETARPISVERNLPMAPIADIDAVGTPGFPKRLKKYRNGNLYYRAEYYYGSDGNLLRVNYSHPESGSEIFMDHYHYNSEGKLIKLEGHDVYNFYWDKDRIVEADKYNAMWLGHSKIIYEYNQQGQLIQKTENNLDFHYSEKTSYSYFEDGNLKTIEQYGDYSQSGVFELISVTTFEGYIEAENLFLELEIIPGQIAQQHFPVSGKFQHINAQDYDMYETYSYKFDAEGRVIEKVSGSNKVVYQYY